MKARTWSTEAFSCTLAGFYCNTSTGRGSGGVASWPYFSKAPQNDSGQGNVLRGTKSDLTSSQGHLISYFRPLWQLCNNEVWRGCRDPANQLLGLAGHC